MCEMYQRSIIFRLYLHFGSKRQQQKFFFDNKWDIFHNLDNCVTCTKVITQWSKLGTCINCSSIRGVHLTHLKYPLQETADHSFLFLLLCTQPYICLLSCFRWLSSVIYMTNKQLWLTYHENWLLFTSTLYSALCSRKNDNLVTHVVPVCSEMGDSRKYPYHTKDGF